MTSPSMPLHCRLCAGPTTTIAKNLDCFKGPATFDVQECESCDVRFAAPMQADAGVYDLIYKNAASVPGYDRYARYADGVAESGEALDRMASCEDVYWGIRDSIAKISRDKGRPLRILEVGSGFGYLTHSLRAAGHECVGIDISAEAVAAASARFGPYYRVADLLDSGEGLMKDPDVVVATELIEHVTEPLRFIARMSELVGQYGVIILTTPNKDLYPRTFAWHTDLAPVHLWWFSKTAVRRMAWDAKLHVRFVDFSSFYGIARDRRSIRSKPQTFDGQGNVVYRDSLVNTTARWVLARWPVTFRLIGRVFLWKLARRKVRDEAGTESLSLCAILTRA